MSRDLLKEIYHRVEERKDSGTLGFVVTCRGMSLSRGAAQDDFRPPSIPVPGLQHRRPNFLTPPNAGPGMRARSHSPLSPPPFREGPAYHQQIHQSQSLQMTQQSNRPQQIPRSYSPQPSGRPRRARQQGGGNGRACGFSAAINRPLTAFEQHERGRCVFSNDPSGGGR